MNTDTSLYFAGCSPRESAFLEKYRDDRAVPALVTVTYTGESKAVLRLFVRSGEMQPDAWRCRLVCDAYVGRDGIGKAREGDMRTPVGDFSLTTPFGILPDPGCAVTYRRVEDHLYWCADRPWYNRLISIRKHPHHCSGEHLIEFAPQYNYALLIGYNLGGVYPEGSAIFLHCFGDKPYTGGCVAVSEEDMREILVHHRKGMRILIG